MTRKWSDQPVSPVTRVLLPPGQLALLCSGHAPAIEVRADAQWYEKARAAPRQRLHRGHVQMVVVVVRDQHRVDRRQFIECDRRWLEAPRTESERRRDVGKHRVYQHPQTIDLDVDAGVSDSERAQPWRGCGCKHRPQRWQWGRRRARLVARKLAGDDLAQVIPGVRRRRLRVDEGSVTVVRVGLGACRASSRRPSKLVPSASRWRCRCGPAH